MKVSVLPPLGHVETIWRRGEETHRIKRRKKTHKTQVRKKKNQKKKEKWKYQDLERRKRRLKSKIEDPPHT